MKYKYILSLLLGLSAVVYAADKQPFITIDDRESLKQIFDKSVMENLDKKLTEDQYFIYKKALEYALTNGQVETIISWDGPDPVTISGSITILKVNNTLQCKDFTQTVSFKEVTFEGKGTGCVVDNKWLIRRDK